MRVPVPSMVISRAAGAAIDALTERLAPHLDATVEEVVRQRGAAIAAAVESERAQHPELDAAGLSARLSSQRGVTALISGGLTSLPSTSPGAGTAVAIVTGLADSVALFYTQTALALAIAAAHGRDLRDADTRRVEMLAILAVASGVGKLTRDGRLELQGEKRDIDAPLTRHELAAINRAVWFDVTRRIARRRAGILLGRQVPFGIGVGVGAGANWLAIQRVSRAARKYYAIKDGRR